MKDRTPCISKREVFFLILFLVLCFLFYFMWSLHNPYNTAPDEGMRYNLIQYMFEKGVIPDGFTEELRTEMYGYSYAYFATFLGALLSVVFMQAASLFSADAFVILMAARMTSLLASTLTLLFLYLSLRKIFSLRVSISCTFMLAMLPQYAFIATYVNNDSLCMLGSSLVLYGWTVVMERGWNVFSTLVTGTGIIIIALSYYNGGAWILMSILFFFTSFYMYRGKVNWEPSRMWKMCALIIAFVFAGVGYFYIRNMVLYDGDMFGLSAIQEAGRLYGDPTLYPENRLTGHNLDIPLFRFLFSPTVLYFSWMKLSFFSFIGVLGAMGIYLPMWIYKYYLSVFTVCGLAFLAFFVSSVMQLRGSEKGSDGRVRQNLRVLFYVCLIICVLIPFILSVYYSYFMDYQSQGRYFYPGMTAFITILGYGMNEIGRFVIRVFKNKERQTSVFFTAMTIAFVFFSIAICIYAYIGFYLPYYALPQ